MSGVQPVAPPNDASFDALPEPVRGVCPACGGITMRPLSAGQGGIPGTAEISDLQECSRCAHRGFAVEFDERDDYASFLRRLDLTWRASQHR